MAYHEIQPPLQKIQPSALESEFGFLRVLFVHIFTPENLITYGLLALILIASGVVRFVAAYQGLPYLTVHDEPELAGTAIRMMQTGDFNPHYFNYGSLMMYVNTAVDVLHYFYLLGQPLHAPDRIDSLDQLVMGVGEYRWYISHPSFFLWNRWVVGLMGVASVGLVFSVGRLLLNRWAGLIGAAFLATTLFHVKHSALVTNDIPVSFLVLVAATFSLLYLRDTAPGYLIAALAFCGLAAACKYNAALSILFPFAAFGLSILMLPTNQVIASPTEGIRVSTGVNGHRVAQSGYRHWLWIALLTVPPIFFLLGMPYALLDLPEFLLGAGWEVVHYKRLGHGADTVQRGFPYLLFQAEQFLSHLGFVGVIAAVIGIVYLLSKRLGWILLFFPLVYLLYMSTMVVSFHRNFLLLYPIAAVAIGCGVAWIGLKILRRIEIALPKFRQPFILVAAVLVCTLFAARFVDAAQYSRNISRLPETRSAMIDEINKVIAASDQPEAFQLGIARELYVHPQDLNRLFVVPTIAPHLELVQKFEQYETIISAATFMDGLDNSTVDTDAAALNRASATLPPPTFTLAGQEALFLADWPIINPTLHFYAVRPN